MKLNYKIKIVKVNHTFKVLEQNSTYNKEKYEPVP